MSGLAYYARSAYQDQTLRSWRDFAIAAEIRPGGCCDGEHAEDGKWKQHQKQSGAV